MESLFGAVEVTAPVFMVVALGWLLRKTGFLSDAFVRELGKFLFSVVYTCKLSSDLYAADIRQVLDARLAAYSGISVVIVTLLAMLVLAPLTQDRKERFALVMTAYRGNTIIFYPVLESLFGTLGIASAVVLTIVLTPTVNLLAAVLAGVYSKAQSPREMLRNIVLKTVKTPMLIGVMIGMTLNLLRVPVPAVVVTAVRSVGVSALPMAMIGLGAQICGQHAKKPLKLVVWPSLFRMAVVPFLILGGAVLLGYRDHLLLALVPMFASPAAISNFPVAQQMGADVDLTNRMILVTTLLSAFSLSLVLFVLKSSGFI